MATIDQFLLVRVGTACLMAGSLTLAYAAVSKRVADGNRTLAFAMVQSCIQFGLSLGPLLGARIAAGDGNTVDYRRAFLLAASLCAVAGIAMLGLRRWSRGGVTSPSEPTGNGPAGSGMGTP